MQRRLSKLRWYRFRTVLYCTRNFAVVRAYEVIIICIFFFQRLSLTFVDIYEFFFPSGIYMKNVTIMRTQAVNKKLIFHSVLIYIATFQEKFLAPRLVHNLKVSFPSRVRIVSTGGDVRPDFKGADVRIF